MLRIFFILALVTGVAACGFHLRGAVKLPADLQPMYVYNADNDELAHQLSILLKENNAVLVTDDQQAASRLKILNQSRSRRVLSVDSLGRAREYELHYNVTYQLKGAHIDRLNVVKLERVLGFDPTNVLGANNEANMLYKDMQKDAARLIVRQINAMTQSTKPSDAASP